MRSFTEADNHSPLRFDRKNYDDIVANLELQVEDIREQLKEPECKCMLDSQFNTYRSSIKTIYNSQVTNGTNLILSWSQIWNDDACALENHVKHRVGRQKWKYFGEKTNP